MQVEPWDLGGYGDGDGGDGLGILRGGRPALRSCSEVVVVVLKRSWGGGAFGGYDSRRR